MEQFSVLTLFTIFFLFVSKFLSLYFSLSSFSLSMSHYAPHSFDVSLFSCMCFSVFFFFFCSLSLSLCFSLFLFLSYLSYLFLFSFFSFSLSLSLFLCLHPSISQSLHMTRLNTGTESAESPPPPHPNPIFSPSLSPQGSCFCSGSTGMFMIVLLLFSEGKS